MFQPRKPDAAVLPSLILNSLPNPDPWPIFRNPTIGMKFPIAFFAWILASSVLVLADKQRLCTEVCWTYHVLDQDCPDNCFASLRPTEEEAALTEDCMVDCTCKFIGNPAGIDMRAYAECRSGCYNYFSPFIDTYQPGTNKLSLFPRAVPNDGLEIPTKKERCILRDEADVKFSCYDLCGELTRDFSQILPNVKQLSLSYYPSGSIETNPDNGIYYKVRPEICQYSCQDSIKKYEDMNDVSSVEECTNRCMESPSLRAQEIQLALDCSSLCRFSRGWAVFGSANPESCLESCLTKSFSNIDEVGVSDSTSMGNIRTIGPEESAAATTKNYSCFTNSYRGAIKESGSESTTCDGNATDNTAKQIGVGEVNGALAWAESAYHSFWFFAWSLLAVAIAIGTQML